MHNFTNPFFAVEESIKFVGKYIAWRPNTVGEVGHVRSPFWTRVREARDRWLLPALVITAAAQRCREGADPIIVYKDRRSAISGK